MRVAFMVVEQCLEIFAGEVAHELTAAAVHGDARALARLRDVPLTGDDGEDRGFLGAEPMGAHQGCAGGPDDPEHRCPDEAAVAGAAGRPGRGPPATART